EITTLNQRFHRIFSGAAESPRIQRVLQGVMSVPVTRRSFHNYTVDELRRSMQHHQEIICALKAKDGERAAAVTRVHVLAARAVHMRHAAQTGQSIDEDATWRKHG